MLDYMLYKEALAASGYTIIKTEELEKLHADFLHFVNANNEVGLLNVNLQIRITEAKNLLTAALPHVEGMVGIASAARGLPEEIITWLEEEKK
jgi:hypothetical protein